MCAVSAVHDYFRQRPSLWPETGNIYTQPNTPQLNQWDRETFEQLKEVLRRLGEIDKKLGEPDCVDPRKEAWMAEVETRLQKLEGK